MISESLTKLLLNEVFHVLCLLLIHCTEFICNLCHRQSIDLYSSVPSPSINFLGTPSLAGLGSSPSLTLTRRHTPEVLPSLSKPLIPPVEEALKPQERRSSHGLLPPLPTRKHSIRKDGKSAVSHGPPISRRSMFGQAVINGNFLI